MLGEIRDIAQNRTSCRVLENKQNACQLQPNCEYAIATGQCNPAAVTNRLRYALLDQSRRTPLQSSPVLHEALHQLDWRDVVADAMDAIAPSNPVDAPAGSHWKQRLLQVSGRHASLLWYILMTLQMPIYESIDPGYLAKRIHGAKLAILACRWVTPSVYGLQLVAIRRSLDRWLRSHALPHDKTHVRDITIHQASVWTLVERLIVIFGRIRVCSDLKAREMIEVRSKIHALYQEQQHAQRTQQRTLSTIESVTAKKEEAPTKADATWLVRVLIELDSIGSPLWHTSNSSATTMPTTPQHTTYITSLLFPGQMAHLTSTSSNVLRDTWQKTAALQKLEESSAPLWSLQSAQVFESVVTTKLGLTLEQFCATFSATSVAQLLPDTRLVLQFAAIVLWEAKCLNDAVLCRAVQAALMLPAPFHIKVTWIQQLRQMQQLHVRAKNQYTQHQFVHNSLNKADTDAMGVKRHTAMFPDTDTEDNEFDSDDEDNIASFPQGKSLTASHFGMATDIQPPPVMSDLLFNTLLYGVMCVSTNGQPVLFQDLRLQERLSSLQAVQHFHHAVAAWLGPHHNQLAFNVARDFLSGPTPILSASMLPIVNTAPPNDPITEVIKRVLNATSCMIMLSTWMDSEIGQQVCHANSLILAPTLLLPCAEQLAFLRETKGVKGTTNEHNDNRQLLQHIATLRVVAHNQNTATMTDLPWAHRETVYAVPTASKREAAVSSSPSSSHSDIIDIDRSGLNVSHSVQVVLQAVKEGWNELQESADQLAIQAITSLLRSQREALTRDDHGMVATELLRTAYLSIVTFDPLVAYLTVIDRMSPMAPNTLPKDQSFHQLLFARFKHLRMVLVRKGLQLSNNAAERCEQQLPTERDTYVHWMATLASWHSTLQDMRETSISTQLTTTDSNNEQMSITFDSLGVGLQIRWMAAEARILHQRRETMSLDRVIQAELRTWLVHTVDSISDSARQTLANAIKDNGDMAVTWLRQYSVSALQHLCQVILQLDDEESDRIKSACFEHLTSGESQRLVFAGIIKQIEKEMSYTQSVSSQLGAWYSRGQVARQHLQLALTWATTGMLLSPTAINSTNASLVSTMVRVIPSDHDPFAMLVPVQPPKVAKSLRKTVFVPDALVRLSLLSQTMAPGR